eukprot:3460118-Karenia_brevis.AAC.1
MSASLVLQAMSAWTRARLSQNKMTLWPPNIEDAACSTARIARPSAAKMLFLRALRHLMVLGGSRPAQALGPEGPNSTPPTPAKTSFW